MFVNFTVFYSGEDFKRHLGIRIVTLQFLNRSVSKMMDFLERNCLFLQNVTQVFYFT